MDVALVFVVALAATLPGEPRERAVEAYSKQARIDQHLDAYAHRLTTPELRVAVGNAALVTRIAVERKVVFRWEF